MAGGFAGAISTPLDVVKTRVMLEAKVGPVHAWTMNNVNSGKKKEHETNTLRRGMI